MKPPSIGSAHHDDFVDTMPSAFLPEMKPGQTASPQKAAAPGGMSLDWRWVTIAALCAAGFIVKHWMK